MSHNLIDSIFGTAFRQILLQVVVKLNSRLNPHQFLINMLLLQKLPRVMRRQKRNQTTQVETPLIWV